MPEITASPEYRFIGFAMLSPEEAVEAANNIGFAPEWFPDEWCKKVWHCITTMLAEGHPIDPVFVAEWGNAHKVPLTVQSLKDAESCAPSSRGSPDALVASIRKDYIRRRLKDCAEDLCDAESDPEDLAVGVGSTLISLAEPHAGLMDMDDVFKRIVDDWCKAKAGQQTGLPMPWKNTYERCGSVEPGQACMWVGCGGAGKSSILTQWVHYLAREIGMSVLYFPFEDTAHTMYKRMACMEASTNTMRMRMGNVHEEEYTATIEGLNRVRALPVHVYDKPMHIKEISALAQRVHAKHTLGAIFIDAFKDISKKEGLDGENETMAGIATLAKRLRLPIVFAHHVRKKPSIKGGNRWESENITKDDVRGSGRLWDDSRMVLVLQQYTEENQMTPARYQFQVLKANHGMAGEYTRQNVARSPSLTWEEIAQD